MAKKSEVPEAAGEEEAIEEAPQAAEETEKVELAETTGEPEEPEAVEASEEEEAGQLVAEEASEEEAAEAEPAGAPQAEAVDVAEETEAVEAPEPVEAVAEAAEWVEQMEQLSEAGEIYYYGTGRRKTATAQVRLYPSKEPEVIVNDKQVDQYFFHPGDLMQLREPLRVTATENMFRITVKVRGGGISGQASAVSHGIARALAKANPELRPTLRKDGFLTRDPRMKERKKPGLKRARKAPQYTKR